MNKKTLTIVYFLLLNSGLIIMLEGYLRLFHYEVLKEHQVPEVYEADPFLGYSFIPNSESFFKAPSLDHAVKISNQGFLGADFTTAKRDSTFRIMIVSYSKLLRDNGRIQNEFTKNAYTQVEIINCSIDGNFLNWHHYLMIRDGLMKYSPDVILFDTEIPFSRKDHMRESYKGFALEYSLDNPVESRNYCTDIVDEIENSIFLASLYDCSFIVRAVCKKLVDKYSYIDYESFTQKYIYSYRRKKVIAGDQLLKDYSKAGTLSELVALSDTLNSQNCLLVVFDYFDLQNQDNKMHICNAHKLPYFNLKIDGEHYHQYLILEHDGHPNDKGQEEIARAFYEAITTRNIIPIKFKP